MTDRGRAKSGVICGVHFDFVSEGDIANMIEGWRGGRGGRYITLANPHSIERAYRDISFSAAIAGSAVTVPDGVGVEWAARFLGYKMCLRRPGPSLMLSVCDLGRRFRLRHYFLGATAEVLVELERRLTAWFPGIELAGSFAPPFRTLSPREDDCLVRRVNDSSADVLWVAFGTGKQEIWMADHATALRVPVQIGVGAAFDFCAGRVPRAPKVLQTAGLEWAYRLAHEPLRLWRRNLDSPRFVGRVLLQKLAESRCSTGAV